ncbi:pitrilysin family protein [Amycolatopsis sp. NPDC004079]|uniref:M16 family metallopeptidase n=1 Tax=Amycolatopsis sp. NPDC004079 TaxID=3154549 RepID=UPI0033B70E2A
MKALTGAVDIALPNGLRVVLAHEPSAEITEIRLALPFATRPELAAPMELLAACLLRGTAKLDRRALIDRASALGAELSVTRDSEALLLSASTLSRSMPKAIALLATAARQATYPAHELDRVADSLLIGDRSGPRAGAYRRLLRHRYGAHPLFAEPAGIEALRAVTTEDLLRLHALAIVPDGAVLLMLGPLGPDAALTRVTDTFGGWSGTASGLHLPPMGATWNTGRMTLPSAPGMPTLVLTAGPGILPTDPEHPALHLANLILGGSGSSRLVRQIRERLGLAYRVQSALEETGAGAWTTVEALTGPGNGARMASELTSCMTQFADDGPTPEEVQAAKRLAKGLATTGLSDRADVASAATGFVLRGLPPGWLSHYLDRISAVCLDEVAAAARHCFDPATHAMAVADEHPTPIERIPAKDRR